MQDRMNLVLDPRAVTNLLIAVRHERPQAFGLSRQFAHLEQAPGGMERRKNPGVDLIRHDMGLRLGDRPDLQRISNDDARLEGRENQHQCHRVASGLDDDLIARLQGLVEPFQLRARHVGAASPSQLPLFPNDHFREGSVYVHSEYMPHDPSPSLRSTGAWGDTTTTDSRSRGNRASRSGGQSRTRTLGSSYTTACPHLVLSAPLSRIVERCAGTVRISA